MATGAPSHLSSPCRLSCQTFILCLIFYDRLISSQTQRPCFILFQRQPCLRDPATPAILGKRYGGHECNNDQVHDDTFVHTIDCTCELSKMKLNTSFLQIGLLALSASSALAASWTFSDATVSVTGKGSGVGSGLKEK